MYSLTPDELLKATAKAQWNDRPNQLDPIPDDVEVVSVDFEGWYDYYSSWTTEVGVTVTMYCNDGTTRTCDNWSVPQALQDMAQYKAEWDQAEDDLYAALESR